VIFALRRSVSHHCNVSSLILLPGHPAVSLDALTGDYAMLKEGFTKWQKELDEIGAEEPTGPNDYYHAQLKICHFLLSCLVGRRISGVFGHCTLPLLLLTASDDVSSLVERKTIHSHKDTRDLTRARCLAQHAFIGTNAPVFRDIEERWADMHWQFRGVRQLFDEEERIKSPDEFFGIFATFTAHFEVRAESAGARSWRPAAHGITMKQVWLKFGMHA
jgi:hypothetical protein